MAGGMNGGKVKATYARMGYGTNKSSVYHSECCVFMFDGSRSWHRTSVESEVVTESDTLYVR